MVVARLRVSGGETLLERKGELALVEGEEPNKRDRWARS